MHSRSFAAACAAALLLLNATPASAAYPERMLTMSCPRPPAAMTCWPASLARRWANCLARPSWW